eukprot:CAMPEP_0114600870 /NCGR_PEP_ID=MMETSP0125-20121206/23505_1 /TAXON_ID=485358 ORGANISM="Aristerostoma sp., Strain ATCC 50986" /NCGR_SAMPLE_ID=MMETSP0125 /ASSEMBLY_ACC=CAM_ASM_000245 /LENGTH=87 /DNA_ID=CAMNT_0001809563 /DNA_START=35 /DNA_END=298 /DNA_ORIENTATION=+
MSKKKGGKKGKGKGKGKGEDEMEEAKEMARMHEQRVEVFQKKLVEERSTADRSKASENEVRSKLVELEKVYKEEEQTRQEIISSMTR